MRTLLGYITLLMLAGLLWACGGDRALQSALDRADALMEVRPDSALTLLKPYDGAQIKSEEQRARFALLYSMALDKNGIDRDDFEVLQPALDYYPTHGTDADKIRTIYYAGCIYQNAKRVDKAMEVWAEALQYRGPKTDSLVLARLLVNQANEYYRLYQFDKFKEDQQQAEEIYRSLGKNSLADKAFLNQFELALNRDSAFAKANIEKVAQLALDSVSFNGELARSKVLQYEMHFGTHGSLDARLNEYEGYTLDSLDLTQVLLNLGRISEAERILLATQPDSAFQIKYLLRKQRLEKAKGDYKEALAYSEEVLKTFDHKQSAVIEGDSQFAEERFRWRSAVEDHKRTEKNIWIASIAIFVFALLISAILYLKLKESRTKKALFEKEAEILKIENEKRLLENERLNIDLLEKERNLSELEAKLLEIQDEKETLEEIIESNNIRDAKVTKALADRLTALNVLFPMCANRVNHDASAGIINNLLADRRKFLRDTRLAYTASHPDFIAFFEEKGLSEDEIEYLCLYAIGFSGKEAGAYMGKKAYYNLSGRVRDKMGIKSEGMHLSRFIRKLLKESQS